MNFARRSLIGMMVGVPMAALASRIQTKPSDAQPASAKATGNRSNERQGRNIIKVSVMYPYIEGSRFDHTYYREKHMPMMKVILGDVCEYYTIEKGLSSREPGQPPAFVAMCSFICSSVEEYRATSNKHTTDIRADIANYTDIRPIVQISEIVVERSNI